MAAAAMLGRPGQVPAQEARRLRFGGYVESQEQLQQTLAVLKRYEELHPGVTINPEFTSFGAFTDKLATEATGGNAPDMFSVNLDLMGEYSRRGVIQPLDQFVPNPLDLSDYLQSAVKANTREGHLWSIPNDAVAPVRLGGEIGVGSHRSILLWPMNLRQGIRVPAHQRVGTGSAPE